MDSSSRGVKILMYVQNDPKSLEKYSSAVTLSDMEVFIFPELMYSLVLANIMSPRLWLWKEDPWFKGIKKMKPQRRIQRLKQYIMDHFSFNLDLDTWGLTTKEKELSRFENFIDKTMLTESNALFGYEGDRYYFDIDIRKHFGLDKYTSEVIPYWKTETLEAMEAFKYKEGYPGGAGECVSLAALYAAASFVVAEIPLKQIFLMTTPLHSQNYLDINHGIITNNRRIVTKNMWFNGTELSAKARRALQNEQVTLVTHQSGYIHSMYNEATMPIETYRHFAKKLGNYLKTEITYEILANFIRHNQKLQSCFQLTYNFCGKPRFIEAEKVYKYEHSSKFRIGSTTQNKLLEEIEEDEYYTTPHPNRVLLDELEEFFRTNKVVLDDPDTISKLIEYLHHSCYDVQNLIEELVEFCQIKPKLPGENKDFRENKIIELDGVNSAKEAQEYLQSIRQENQTADLAFTAFRCVNSSSWKPFLKAALERNPVGIDDLKTENIQKIYSIIESFANESIYSENTRLAQPDEVWNFRRGDGLEKALCFLNICKNRYPHVPFSLSIEGESAKVIFEGETFQFATMKRVAQPEPEDFDF
ncbi:hypothetical protein CHISP_1435 [Chitinispirillum alkaliphilum]|nr:hypothetical protein CHISP_1435 [Chitinispirillum alkaliphilum]